MSKQLDTTETQDRRLAKKEDGGIVAYLQSIAPKLEEAATRHLAPDRLIRVFLGIAARQPKIYECTRESIVNALSMCTSTGLEPGGILKHADLIPRRNRKNGNRLELNFQPRYGGMAELARRSGEVARITAAPVYKWELERDLFAYTHEPPAIRHDWCPDPPELVDTDIVGGYAVAELENGQRIQLWMSRKQVERRRACSPGRDGNFWRDWYPEMVRKTLLRALFSGGLVPMSTELALAMEHDPDRWDTSTERSTASTRSMGMFRQAEQAPTPTVEVEVEVEAEVVQLPEPSVRINEAVQFGVKAGLAEQVIAAALAAEGIPTVAGEQQDQHADAAEHIINDMINNVGG